MRRLLALCGVGLVAASSFDRPVVVAASTPRLCGVEYWSTPAELLKVRRKQLDEADAVFAGKVADLKEMTAVFLVDRFWKGDVKKDFTVLTGFHIPPNMLDAESFHFVKGREYLVYALKTPAGLATNACMWTQQLDKAGDDIKALDTFTPHKTPGGR